MINLLEINYKKIKAMMKTSKLVLLLRESLVGVKRQEVNRNILSSCVLEKLSKACRSYHPLK
jgi:hypothetical protein